MSDDARRAFLLRFASAALLAAGGGCDTATDPVAVDPMPYDAIRPMPHVVYGPPPGPPPNRRAEYFQDTIGSVIYFDSGRLDLSIEAKSTLDRQIHWLIDNPHFSLILKGHADDKGSREMALALGERRATAVKNYMVLNGVDAQRITVLSVGKEQPAVPGTSKQARAENRRVDVILE